MIQLMRQLNGLFSRRERSQLSVLVFALVFRALVEMVGVGSIAPFMSVVADTSKIHTDRWLHHAYDTLGFESVTSFLTVLGVAVIILIGLSNTVSAVTTWAMLRFSWGAHHRISTKLLRGYLAQPYSFFVERNSAGFSNSILSEVQSVINGVLTPVLTILSRILVVAALAGLLFVQDPVLASAVVAVLGGAYGVLYTLVKSKQRRLGREKVAANEQRYKVTNEAFGGIKDVIVLQREKAFVSRFAPASWNYSRVTASNAVVTQVPRYLFETIAFGGMILIVLYFLQVGQDVSRILPTISLYAFAGYRLMPELQQLFGAVAQIRFNHAALDDLTRDLEKFELPTEHPSQSVPHLFREGVQFDSVTFRYAGCQSPALDAVSLTIPKDHTIGLVGASGSGKTTLVDLLLGLYQPDSGQITIDGIPLSKDMIPAWLCQVGYVPQQIFLSDDTIASNIAFGVPAQEIDMHAVERAGRIAHLHEFILGLPEGYSTLVGERGVRLSGGQRQRIGIARALYHDPSVLIMDEATSALDGETEDGVMEAIRALAGQKTIVLIAHRLSTVESCDSVILLDSGKIADSGSFVDLARRNESFRRMAKLSSLAAAGV